MTREQIINRAEELGIEFSKNHKTVDIAKKIETVTGEEITIEKAKKTKPKAAAAETKTEARTIKAIVYSGDRDNDETDFFAALNGETCAGPIGIECDFPVKFLPVLQDASYKEHIYETDEEGIPTGKRAVRIKKRYIVEKL